MMMVQVVLAVHVVVILLNVFGLVAVAETLGGIADTPRFDPRRDQLLALADGFERFAHRLEQGMKVDA